VGVERPVWQLEVRQRALGIHHRKRGDRRRRASFAASSEEPVLAAVRLRLLRIDEHGRAELSVEVPCLENELRA